MRVLDSKQRSTSARTVLGPQLQVTTKGTNKGLWNDKLCWTYHRGNRLIHGSAATEQKGQSKRKVWVSLSPTAAAPRMFPLQQHDMGLILEPSRRLPAVRAPSKGPVVPHQKERIITVTRLKVPFM